MGNITIQGDLTGGVPGGEVGGASNLTTVGAIPYVSAPGVLNQDGTGLKYDSTGKLVYVAAATAAETAIIGRYTAGSVAALYLGVATPSTSNYSIAANGTSMLLNAPLSTGSMSFNQANTERARFAATTGNLLLGGTTDDGAPVQVFNSGVSTTLGQFSNNLRLNNQQNTVVGAGSEISFRGQGTALNTAIYAAISAPITGAGVGGSAGYLSFSTKLLGVDTALTERMRIASGGNVLIGTTTDDTTNKLQVVGTYQAAFLSASGSSNNYTKIDSAAGARVYQTNGSGTVVNLIQSSSSASYFNAGNLLIGTTTDDGTNKLQVAGNGVIGSGTGQRTLKVFSGDAGASESAAVLSLFSSGYREAVVAVTNNGMVLTGTTGGLANYNNATINAASALTIANTSKNLLVGTTTTDSGFKLDIASSGSSGTFRVYDQTATTGVSRTVFRNGAGQSATEAIQFQISDGSVRGRILTDNAMFGSQFYYYTDLNAGFRLGNVASVLLELSTSGMIQFSSTASYSGTKDLSLSRASAGVLQVGDGGANALGQVNARAVNSVNTLVAYNSTGGIFMAGNAGSSWGTMQSYSDGAGTAKATAINPNGGNVLVGTTTDDGASKLQVAGNVKVTAGSNNLTVSGSSGQTPGILFNQSAVGNFYIRSQASTANLEIINDSLVRLASLSQAGTFSVYNETATTGSTKVVVRAGAGQSGNLLSVQNSAGTEGIWIPAAGTSMQATGGLVVGGGSGNLSVGFYSTDVRFGTGWGIAFSSSSAANGTLDLGLARNAAGVLEINNGTAGTYRDILARRYQASGETVASLPAAAAGNAGTISYVTDANATTIGSTVAGGGANKVLVWSNGTAWKIFAN